MEQAEKKTNLLEIVANLANNKKAIKQLRLAASVAFMMFCSDNDEQHLIDFYYSQIVCLN
jgi:hypothetical protein